jgi:hypothetical protein
MLSMIRPDDVGVSATETRPSDRSHLRRISAEQDRNGPGLRKARYRRERRYLVFNRLLQGVCGGLDVLVSIHLSVLHLEDSVQLLASGWR